MNTTGSRASGSPFHRKIDKETDKILKIKINANQ